MDNAPAQQILVSAALTFLTIAGWIALSVLVAYMSGWRQLAKVYRATQPISGQRFRPWAASMRMGANYNGMITTAAGPQGLYLSMLFLFRAGHPPLFIPWTDISTSIERKWPFNFVRLQFKGYESTYLLLPLKLADRFSHASGYQFQFDRPSNT